MFSTKHFIWIGLCVLFVVGMSVFSYKKKISLKASSFIMVGICVISEVSKIMSNMLESTSGGRHLDPKCLPFHLCSLMIFVIFYIAFGKESKCKRTLINFIAVIGTLGSFCAIMIPTNGVEFNDIGAYQCFVYHAGLMWYSLYLIISKEACLGLKEYLSNLLMLLALVFMEIYINSVLSIYDTNFLYLTRPPMNNLPYLNLNQGWYIYFLKLLLLGALIITIFHLPFIIKKHKNNS